MASNGEKQIRLWRWEDRPGMGEWRVGPTPSNLFGGSIEIEHFTPASQLHDAKRRIEELENGIVRADVAQPGEVVSEWQELVDLADPNADRRRTLADTKESK